AGTHDALPSTEQTLLELLGPPDKRRRDANDAKAPVHSADGAAGFKPRPTKLRWLLHTAKPTYDRENRKLLLDAIRQSEAHVVGVRLVHLNLVQKVAHLARALGPGKVALAGTPAQQLAGGRNLNPLGGAAVRLELHFLVLLHDALNLFLGLAAGRGLRGAGRR